MSRHAAAIARCLLAVMVAMAGCGGEERPAPASAVVAPARDACTPEPPPPPAERRGFEEIRLRRTGCLGSCPELEVAIDREGAVSFHRWSPTLGRDVTHARTLDAAAVQALAAALDRSGLASTSQEQIDAACVDRAIDLPSSFLSIREEGAVRALHVDHGCPRTPTVVALIELSETIMSTAVPAQWLGDLADGLVAGTLEVKPPESVARAIADSNQAGARALAHVCFSSQGKVRRRRVVKSSGYPAYDAAIASEIRQWRVQPALGNRCIDVVFDYRK